MVYIFSDWLALLWNLVSYLRSLSKNEFHVSVYVEISLLKLIHNNFQDHNRINWVLYFFWLVAWKRCFKTTWDIWMHVRRCVRSAILPKYGLGCTWTTWIGTSIQTQTGNLCFAFVSLVNSVNIITHVKYKHSGNVHLWFLYYFAFSFEVVNQNSF